MRGSLGRLARLLPGVDDSLRRRDQEIARLEAVAHQAALRAEKATLDADGAKRQVAEKTQEAAELQDALAARTAELAGAWEHAHKLDAALQRLDGIFKSANYNSDSLLVYNKNVSFLRDERFMSAYRYGVHSGHKIGRPGGLGEDIHIEWRVHVACWAAEHARRLPGSFVECGVNTGILSLAACQYIDFNAADKDFYLFDTFDGIPEEQMLPAERADRLRENGEIYEECYDLARRNFARFPRAHLVRGLVPDTLTKVNIDKVCYLSIDMNIVQPEIAAMEFFWDKLVPGAVVVLDDYGWANYRLQQEAHNRFAESKGVPILLLPTGQGLLIKS